MTKTPHLKRRRYTGKLRGLLEADGGEFYTAPTDADRVASVLADFNKAVAAQGNPASGALKVIIKP